jgi:hypothetical protein
MSIPSKKSGYTLLFAVLISVLILGVAVFMSGIARKEYILSSTALDSMYSFYAADSGIECVMYQINGIASTTETGKVVDCNGKSVGLGNWSSDTSTFNLDFKTNASAGCAVITIEVNYTPESEMASSTAIAVVTSRGYNLCTGSGPKVAPDKTSPRTVERALQTSVVL